jgi:hypothetical protein
MLKTSAFAVLAALAAVSAPAQAGIKLANDGLNLSNGLNLSSGRISNGIRLTNGTEMGALSLDGVFLPEAAR